MPMLKSDDEIKRGWGPLERSFEKWYADNQEAISATRRRGSSIGDFDRLWSRSYPRKHHAAFDKWCNEWLGRHLERRSRPVRPQEFIQTVLNTNFTDTNSASNLFWKMDAYNISFIPLGRSSFGNVPTYYAFKPTGRFLQPDVETEGPGIAGNQILSLNLIDTMPESGSETGDTSNPLLSESSTSTVTGETPTDKARGEIDPSHFVFAQLGALYVFGEKCEDDEEYDQSALNKGRWWSNGFAVVVRLSEKGVPGAVYTIYNHGKQIESIEDEEEDDYDGSPEAVGHIPGYLHPRCTEGFKFAKVADNVEVLGDFTKRFTFIPITQNENQIVRTRVWQSEVNYEVKEGEKVWDCYVAPVNGSWKEPTKPKK